MSARRLASPLAPGPMTRKHSKIGCSRKRRQRQTTTTSPARADFITIARAATVVTGNGHLLYAPSIATAVFTDLGDLRVSPTFGFVELGLEPEDYGLIPTADGFCTSTEITVDVAVRRGYSCPMAMRLGLSDRPAAEFRDGRWLLRSWAVIVALAVGCGGGGDDAPTDAATATDATPNDNATLSALITTAGMFDPPFEPNVTEYHLDLVLAEPDVAFTPTAAVPDGTTITVDDTEIVSAATSPLLALTPGSRDVEIVVVATSGAAQIYRVHVHRGVDALASLTPSSDTLVPTFDPAITSYETGLPVTTSTLAWTPTLLTPGRARITIDGADVPSGSLSSEGALVDGNNPTAVVVTPQTRPARTYDVGVFRGIDALASITLSYGSGAVSTPLLPTFNPTNSTYSLDVGLWLQRLQISVTPLYAGSTITIGGGPATAGTPTAPISLNLGLTPIAITVTAPGGAQRTYTLNVTRASAVLQQAYAKASNTGASNYFGTSVALSGDTLAVGAYLEESAATGVGGNQADNSAAGSGAVYIFTRTGTTWAQQAYLKASNTAAYDFFGIQLALSGDTLAVGAFGEDSAATGSGGNQADNTAADSGAVYMFTRTGTTWSQEAYLKASNTGAGDYFGYRVALWGQTLAVGALNEDSAATGGGGNQASNTAADSGAVYVFTRTGTIWSQEAYLKASNTGAGDLFARSVALWGDTLVVGAMSEASAATGVGGNQADNTAANSGAGYVFTRTGTTWSQQAYLKASNTGAGDYFGFSVAVWGDTLVVGAFGEASASANPADNSAAASGAVYVFTRTGTTWSQPVYIKASNPQAGDRFGDSVALWGDTFAVGATSEDSAATGVGGNQADNSASGSGAVYVYALGEVTGGAWVWSQRAYLKASNTGTGDAFGSSLALWGDTLAVSAHLEDSAATGIGGNQADNSAVEGGSVYILH